MPDIHIISGGEQGPPGPQGVPGIAGVAYASMVNADFVTLPVGTPVYLFGANSVKRCRGNVAVTADCIGFVRTPVYDPGASGFIQVDGICELTTAEWDVITQTVGGLVSHKSYFLSTTDDGKITYDVPSEEVTGVYLARIGYAVNATTLKIEIEPTILL
jgi:hypothetical protein